MKKQTIILFMVVIAAWAVNASGNDFGTEYPNGNDVWAIEFQGDYVWSGTYGSLVRWDKRDGSYVMFTDKDGLSSNLVIDLLVTDSDELLIATSRGVQRYNEGTFETITSEDSGISLYFAMCLAQSDDGAIWVGSAKGLSKYDGESWETIPLGDMIPVNDPEGQVDEIVIDKNGVLWLEVFHYESILKNRSYLVSYDGESMTVHNDAEGGLSAVKVTSLAVDNENRIWAATKNANNNYGPLFIYDGEVWTETEVQSVHDISVASDGTVYLACGDYSYGDTDDKSIIKYDGSAFSNIIGNNDISEKVMFFQHVFADDDGSIWFVGNTGHHLKPLYSFDDNEVQEHFTEGPRSYWFEEVTVDAANTKWFATSYGLSRYDGYQWENILFEPDPLHIDDDSMFIRALNDANRVWDVVIDNDGVVWCVTSEGIRSYNGAEWILYNEKTTEELLEIQNYESMRFAAIGSDNAKWFASQERLYKYDGQHWIAFPLGDLRGYINSMAIDKNDVLWFGIDYPDGRTLKEGAASFDGTSWIFYNEDNSPLKGEMVYIAVDSKNTKWVVSKKGYYSFDDVSWTSYEDIKQADYPDFQPQDIFIDNDDVVWFMVRGYLHSFDGVAWDNHGKQRFGSSMATQIAVDAAGDIWIASQGTAGSLVSFNKAAIRTDVETEEAVPAGLSITGNNPNPFNPYTTIDFTIDKSGFASMVICNIMGQKVRTLMSERLNSGVHFIVWDGRDDSGRFVSSGTYISRLKNGDKVTAKRMMLLK